jgi:hypothetical protein
MVKYPTELKGLPNQRFGPLQRLKMLPFVLGLRQKRLTPKRNLREIQTPEGEISLHKMPGSNSSRKMLKFVRKSPMGLLIKASQAPA